MTLRNNFSHKSETQNMMSPESQEESDPSGNLDKSIYRGKVWVLAVILSWLAIKLQWAMMAVLFGHEELLPQQLIRVLFQGPILYAIWAGRNGARILWITISIVGIVYAIFNFVDTRDLFMNVLIVELLAVSVFEVIVLAFIPSVREFQRAQRSLRFWPWKPTL